jgi:hypothetical protein
MNNKELKTFLLKLLNINMYALTKIVNYEGKFMSDDFNLNEYAQVN